MNDQTAASCLATFLFLFTQNRNGILCQLGANKNVMEIQTSYTFGTSHGKFRYMGLSFFVVVRRMAHKNTDTELNEGKKTKSCIGSD